MRSIGVEERRARLAHRHLLLPRTRVADPVAVADALVALHATDPVTVYLSVAARLQRPSLAVVDQALYEDRTLVRHHAMRRTLWVATPATVRRMHAAATQLLVANERRRTLNLLRAAGVEHPEQWLTDAGAQVLAKLREHGPATAKQLGERVPALRQRLFVGAGTRFEAVQSAHTRVILGLGFEGAVLRARPAGSWVSGAYHYVAAEDWLAGGLSDLDRRSSAAELVAAYLRRFGPVTTADVAWWMGATLTATRQALSDCDAVPVDLGGRPGWIASDDEPPADPQPWVAALPALDPTPMGWKERSWYLPEAASACFDRNGNAGPTLWVDGRIVGVWAQRRDGDLATHYFEAVPVARRRALTERLQMLRALVGDTRFTVRFPSPAHKRLIEGEGTPATVDEGSADSRIAEVAAGAAPPA